jgi:SET domain-containing protein
MRQKSPDVPMPTGLAVKPVRNGLGIVALKAFRRGAVICEIEGKLVTGEEVWRYWDSDPRLGENCFRYDDDHYIDPDGQIGQYANHSCNPNAGIVKKGRRLLLKAIMPIAVGEEVTHDYSTLLGADDVWKMRCNCGVADCRRVVKNIGKLPAATVRKYRRLGIVPDFILATRN